MKQTSIIIYGVVTTMLLTVLLPTSVNAESVFERAITASSGVEPLTDKAASVVETCNSKTLAGDTEIIPVCDRFAQSLTQNMRQYFVDEETKLNKI